MEGKYQSILTYVPIVNLGSKAIILIDSGLELSGRHNETINRTHHLWPVCFCYYQTACGSSRTLDMGEEMISYTFDEKLQLAIELVKEKGSTRASRVRQIREMFNLDLVMANNLDQLALKEHVSTDETL